MSRWMVVNLTNTLSQRVSATGTCRRGCEDVEIKHRGTVSHPQLCIAVLHTREGSNRTRGTRGHQQQESEGKKERAGRGRIKREAPRPGIEPGSPA